MSKKTDYSAEEWKVLLTGPLIAGLAVAATHVGLGFRSARELALGGGSGPV